MLLGAYNSAEFKSYFSVVTVLALAAIVPLYGRFTDRVPRRRLINVVVLIFAGLLLAFFLAGQTGLPIALPFYLYRSIFSVFVVALVWSFANDIYTRAEGERLFPLVALGASIGGAVGPFLVSVLIAPYGLQVPILFAAGMLLMQLVIVNYVDRRERRLREAHLPDIKTTATIAASGILKAPTTLEELEALAAMEKEIYDAKDRGEDVPEPEVSSGESAFGLVWRTRYLLLICLLIMLLNWVNTTGEYILDNLLIDAATEAVTAGTEDGLTADGLTGAEWIGQFKAGFNFVVSILALLIQFFVTSRVVKYLGVHVGIMMLPAIALGAYAVIAFVPVLAAVRWAKTAENSMDYSLNNAVKQMLFLPTTREQKYKAKQVSDSFFHKAGDVLSAATVLVGTSVLALGTTGFAIFNLSLVAVWLAIALAVGRHYRELVRTGRPPWPRRRGVVRSLEPDLADV